jgi:mono/diheme cytochrome c family protein
MWARNARNEEMMTRKGSLSKPLGLLITFAFFAACGDAAEEAPPPPAAVEPSAPAPAPAPAAPGAAADLPVPAGATAEMVAQGQQVFVGTGICFTCHGQNAQGTPLGPSLVDGNWLWIEAPEQDLLTKLTTLIRTGVAEPREYPAPMPPMGGASLSEDQLNAVAAYVAALNS